MILDKIKKTNDIHNLNLEEKKLLASEIREYLIDITSKNGGHLASNLGVVELTIALESVFDLNHDKIIWDVGHQSYVHKILNGRKEELKGIRTFGGISGFPNTNESKTDCFNTGHSSTSISAAMGIAKARDLQHEKFQVIAVIGDGALTGGMAFEALNHVGSEKTKMIIILNDNKLWKKIIGHIPFVGKHIVKFISQIKDTIKKVIVPGMYFEEIGIKYLGPIDGHDILKLEQIFEEVKTFEEPVVIHVITKKGKGYSFAEENPSKFHGIAKFNPETGELLEPSKKTYSSVFGEYLIKLASKNQKIVAITAAMKDGVGLSNFARLYPKRFFDAGIAEQHALTLAAGLAKGEMIPFISIYSSFYQRGYDQIIHDICLQNLHVIMCIDRAGLVGADGKTHQGLYDMAFLKLIPNMVIMAPKDFKELEMMMAYAVDLKCPVAIRYPRGGENYNFIHHEKIEKFKSEVIKTGNDLTIISIGNMVGKAIKIANILEEKNIFCDVINIRFLKPIDEKTLLNSFNKTKNIVIIEDGTIIGGLITSIKELIVDNELRINYFKGYAYPDQFIEHGSIKDLEKKYQLDDETILSDIYKYFEKR